MKLGCPLNNLVQEMSPVDRGFQKRLQTALNLWIDRMDEHLKRAQRNGYIRRGVDTKDVSRFVVMTHEGIFGMLKGLDDPSVVDPLIGSLKAYLATLKEKA